jgi:hypothetical protein
VRWQSLVQCPGSRLFHACPSSAKTSESTKSAVISMCFRRFILRSGAKIRPTVDYRRVLQQRPTAVCDFLHRPDTLRELSFYYLSNCIRYKSRCERTDSQKFHSKSRSPQIRPMYPADQDSGPTLPPRCCSSCSTLCRIYEWSKLLHTSSLRPMNWNATSGVTTEQDLARAPRHKHVITFTNPLQHIQPTPDT